MWTTEYPKEEGFFWYREDAQDFSPIVVEAAIINGRVRFYFPANDEGQCPDGEFWSERLTRPSHE